MKALALALLLSSVARAESRPEALAPLRVDQVTLDRAMRRARAKRNVGIALAVPGVASTVLGLVLISYASLQEPNLNAEVGEYVAGGLTGLVGLALGIPGCVLWTTGQDEMDVVKWRRKQLVVPFARIDRDGARAGLQISF
jgi:hypothetical protein